METPRKNCSEHAAFLGSISDLLRGDYKQSEYSKVILPMTLLRRLDQVLASTNDAVWAADQKYPVLSTPESLREQMLLRASGQFFYNTSKFSFGTLNFGQLALDLTAYISGFSKNAREIFDRFHFEEHIERLDRANLLYLVVSRVRELDLHPERVSNFDMGCLFEELIRRFSESSNSTAGEHFTPREVILLMVNLLFIKESLPLNSSVVQTMYDPACGTGGMLSVAEEYLQELNFGVPLEVFGQELNEESFAICKADRLIKGGNTENITLGNTFTEDGHANRMFDYLISNPPFGVDWSKVEPFIRKEHEQKGHAGRFGPGLPRKSDGSLLFLLHMISKMKHEGSRLALVFNGSPLFTGGAESGESQIRRWILENDWLEGIVALPDQLFYNTGISTYIWVLSTRKHPERKGKVQLVNAVSFFEKMRKSLGNKRNKLSDKHIEEITRIYSEFQEGKLCKVFDTEDFGYHRITVERPMRLNFQASPERIELVKASDAFQNLVHSKKKGKAGIAEVEAGTTQQEALLKVLGSLDANRYYRSRPEFLKVLDKAFKAGCVAMGAPIKKAVLAALAERDETAEVCTDTKGNPEPDFELRDNENVPLKEDLHAYFEREVLPHVPDAWIDPEKTKVGYEIPFTRHFYEYKPLRPLEEIEAEIRALEVEIQGTLVEVMA